MKGGIISALISLMALRALGYRPAGRLHFQTVPEEENSGNGALACCHRGYRADGAIIPEPFGDNITTGQCSVMWMNIDLDGKPAHVLDTSKGVSAIEAAYAVFATLKEEEVRMNAAKPAAYADFARPINFNLGVIEGGNWPSSVASHCQMRLRVGGYPGDSLADLRTRLEAIVSTRAAELAVQAQVHWVGFRAEGFLADPKTPLFTTLSDSFRTATGREPVMAPLTCTTDARFFHVYHNIPAACLGPQAQRIHGVDECVSIDSLMETALAYALFIIQWQGVADLKSNE